MAVEKLYRVIARVFVAIFGVVMFATIYHYNANSQVKVFTLDSPLLFPMLTAILLAACFVINWYQDIKHLSDEEKKGPICPTEKKKLTVALGVWLCVLAYVLLLQTTHFILGTVAYLTIFMTCLNKKPISLARKALSAFAVAACYTLAIYGVFSGIFQVILP